MELIAHRGFAGVNPENTVAAVERAAPHADAVEVDVRRCGSGELVVVHDETVDRVTDGTGAVADHTVGELAALDVLGSGEGIPTLDELLDAVPPAVWVNVELKERGLAPDALAAADRVSNDVLVSSFLEGALVECREVDPGAPVAYLCHEDGEEALDRAVELGCTHLHPHVDLVPAVVDRARDAGLAVNAWTVEERATAERLAERGVDGVIADVPAAWEAERDRS